MLSDRKILVTGCAGFIGGHFVEKLLSEGAKVIGLDDLSRSQEIYMKSYLHHKNFEFIKDTVINSDLVEKLVGKVDSIFHCAVSGVGVSVQNPFHELEVNVTGTLNILEAAKMHRNQMKKILIPSSASVYGNPIKLPESELDLPNPVSPYGVTKLAAEKYALAYFKLYKLPIVSLRYFNVYGPRQKFDSLYGGVVSIFIKKMLGNHALTIYGDGNQTRDFTFINDCINATYSSFISDACNGQVINIGSGVETSINLIAENLEKIYEKKLPRKKLPKRLIDNVDRRLADISLANKFIDYEPITVLYDGLKETYEFYKNCSDY